MRWILRQYFQLYAIMLFWVIAGIALGNFAVAVVTPIVLLMWYKRLYLELLIGLMFVLTLSDSMLPQLVFAKSMKIVYIVLMGAVYVANYRDFTPHLRLINAFVPFLIIAMICVFRAEEWTVAIQKTISYGLLILVVPNFLYKSYREKGVEVFRVLLWLMMFILFFGIFMKYFMGDAATLAGRFRGVFGNPNGLGLYCIVAFFFFQAVNHIRPNLFSRQEKIVFYMLILLCVYWSSSRTALTSIVLYFVFSPLFKVSWFVGFITFIIAVLSYDLIYDMVIDTIINLGMSETFRLDTLEEGSGRFVAWEFAWQNIQENLFLGKGFAYDEILMHRNKEYLSMLGHQGGVHNTYLTMWLNVGLIGLMAFVFGLFKVFIKAGKRYSITWPIFFSILFSSIFESWLAASLNPFTIVFVLVMTVLFYEEFSESPQKVEEEDSEELSYPGRRFATA